MHEDRAAFERAVRDVQATWPDECDEGACRDCGYTEQIRHQDDRCFRCTIAFVLKLRSIALIAEPWALKEARRGGFANQ